jgi:hypothetical protein
VVQHISTFDRADEGGGWLGTFTQEWPAPSQRHQLGFTLAYLDLGAEGAADWGDVALNYRYQVRGFGDDPVALAPRASLLLPYGDAERGLGSGSLGLQLNLPVSVELGPCFVGHWNVGGSWVPDAEATDGTEADATTVQLGQGLIWLARPKLNFLLEAVWSSVRAPIAGGGTAREEVLLVSPGLRFAIDRPSGLQIVPGVAVPMGVGPSDGDLSIFFYLSLEHPF